MRTIQVGIALSAFALLSGCAVDNEPPVSSSKEIRQLSSDEVYDLCDWALDYMGGINWNQIDGDEENPTVRHRCPATQEDLGDRDNIEARYVYYNADSCVPFMASFAGTECSLSVGTYAGWWRDIADAPCSAHITAMPPECGASLVWNPEEQE